MPVRAYLYAEDALCGSLGEAITRHVRPDVVLVKRVTRGFGRIRSDLSKLASLAAHEKVIVIVDLDRHACPLALLEGWRLDRHACPGLAFRIAVRECESWLMADAEGAANYFGLSAGALPPDPDAVPEPKEHLLTLLRRKSRNRRRILDDVLPAKTSTAKVGLGYNARLCQFVDDHWSPARAASRSDSLERAISRARALLY